MTQPRLGIPRTALRVALAAALLSFAPLSQARAESQEHNPCHPGNPCAGAANPCNPCAGKNPCNPCAGEPNPCNPCAPENPCNPCGEGNPCNPCGGR